MPDIGFAVTVVLPDGYFSTELFVAVPGDSHDPEGEARRLATRQLARLEGEVPEARLEITAVRRVG